MSPAETRCAARPKQRPHIIERGVRERFRLGGRKEVWILAECLIVLRYEVAQRLDPRLRVDDPCHTVRGDHLAAECVVKRHVNFSGLGEMIERRALNEAAHRAPIRPARRLRVRAARRAGE